jgi:hypothetical protein
MSAAAVAADSAAIDRIAGKLKNQGVRRFIFSPFIYVRIISFAVSF